MTLVRFSFSRLFDRDRLLQQSIETNITDAADAPPHRLQNDRQKDEEEHKQNQSAPRVHPMSICSFGHMTSLSNQLARRWNHRLQALSILFVLF